MTTCVQPNREALLATYTGLLSRFYDSEDQDVLAREAGAIGREFLAASIEPMEIKDIHDAAVEAAARPGTSALSIPVERVLLEVLLSYGAAYNALTDQLLAEAHAAEQSRIASQAQSEEQRLALLAAVSHGLGNPLMVVRGNVASIRKLLENRGTWSEDLNQREADIEFAVQRMMTLREELLAASRNERLEFEISPLPLASTLRNVVRWGEFQATEKSMRVEVECSDELPYVMADLGALQSILVNLLSNAIRYTNEGGLVTLKAHDAGSDVVIEVTDNGMGISEEDQLRIWERFYRTATAQDRAAFGVGLGLAITRDLVTSLSGTIDVTSEVGVGSTFTVVLPTAQPADEPHV